MSSMNCGGWPVCSHAYPFHAEGIVTNPFTDANGTQHINLHRIPDRSGLWRYLASSCCCCQWWGVWFTTPRRPRVVINATAAYGEIQKYYESCL
ncbi:intracellular growth attenuator family protein [Klebsiella pneumoniae]|nr:intracellular growth attenuator family protein [Klebsiella pneumoniae]